MPHLLIPVLLDLLFIAIMLWYAYQEISRMRRRKSFSAAHAVYCRAIVAPGNRMYACVATVYIFLSLIMMLLHYQQTHALSSFHFYMLGTPLLLLTLAARRGAVFKISEQGILLHHRVYAWEEVGSLQFTKLDRGSGNRAYHVKMTLAHRPAQMWTGVAGDETKRLITAQCDKHKVIVQDNGTEVAVAG